MFKELKNTDNILDQLNPGTNRIGNGFDIQCVSFAVSLAAQLDGPVLFVCVDEPSMHNMAEMLAWVAPHVPGICVPAWDCLPYDRISPTPDSMARRLAALCALGSASVCPRIILTTSAAFIQRSMAPERAAILTQMIASGEGNTSREELLAFLSLHGYTRSERVDDIGEYAIRGGLVDLLGPSMAKPARLDFFGDTLESIRLFEIDSQQTVATTDQLHLIPMSEITLDSEAIERFRSQYRTRFGADSVKDALYQAISEGRRHDGMEHFLGLFDPTLANLFDYIPDRAPVLYGPGVENEIAARLELIEELYQSRLSPPKSALTQGAAPYRALAPDKLYLDADKLAEHLATRVHVLFQAGPVDSSLPSALGFDCAPTPRFATARTRSDRAVWVDARDYIRAQRAHARRVILCVSGQGGEERMAALLKEHEIDRWSMAADWPAANRLPREEIAIARLPLARGCTFGKVTMIAEADLLGDRPVRSQRRRMRAKMQLPFDTLTQGDLVVHEEHGIGRYEGLLVVDLDGAPHDCLCILYDGNDKLFVPIENIDILTRYGDADGKVRLDRLGVATWQGRKAKIRKRLKDIADSLLQMAAQRLLATAPIITVEGAQLTDFSAHFPYIETEDQVQAIEDTLTDLASGHPMDRLICGDVGFGKTEIALRAAYVTAMAGWQVAVLVPTTLLARQHMQLFKERFAGFPIRVGQLSRMIQPGEAARIRAELAEGTIEIVIGTHALLGKNVSLKRLGLIIVDEEHRFGVAQKERLKQLGRKAHLMSLTATPIPRTLQMALSSVRSMSLIATPPIDRLAVRTHIGPFDPVIMREALTREHLRGGQSFVVCPRVRDLPALKTILREITPELRTAIAHGQTPPAELERIMLAFQDQQTDILITTNIIESGLDLPSVNTMILHHADRFGLAQLYQLRGRVGRGKRRGYAYLMLGQGVISENATKRLDIMARLDHLGAGFELASHDLDIRGAGNLLGSEQSGHIREVGVELYQRMLEEAIAKTRDAAHMIEESWTPQIHLGLTVMIPDTYVKDLGLRLNLYQRIAGLQEIVEINDFTAELADRFGPIPDALGNLLRIVKIKLLCRKAGVERIQAGERGASLRFHRNRFARPDALIAHIAGAPGQFSLRPNHQLVFRADWRIAETRVLGAFHLIQLLADMTAKPEEEEHKATLESNAP